MKICIILVGLPGSGKSTLVNAIKQIHSDVGIINFDQWRIEDYLKKHPEDKDLPPDDLYKRAFEEWNKTKDITKWTKRIKEAYKHKIIVVDNTNLTKKHRELFVKLAKEHKALCIVVYFDVPISLAIKRDKQRRNTDKSVGEKVIRKLYSKLELPELSEGYDFIIKVNDKNVKARTIPLIILYAK